MELSYNKATMPLLDTKHQNKNPCAKNGLLLCWSVCLTDHPYKITIHVMFLVIFRT